MNTQNREILSQDLRIGKFKNKYFSWSAVIVGALVGLGVSFLLNIFGISIGLSAFAASDTTSNLTFAIGGFLGLLLIAIVSMGVLGWVAGYLGAFKRISCNDSAIHCNYGCLYGFTAWSLALILTVLLSASVGKFITYSVAALANPVVAVEKYSNPFRVGNENISMGQRTIVTDTRTTTVNSEEAKKKLAIASFVAFVLFFTGAFSATLAGHIAFERCARKHGVRIE